MAQTVIGIFDYTSEAQEAVNHLVNHGFSRENIDLSARAQTENTSTTTSTGYSDQYDDDSHSGVSGFFSNLFGTSDDANKYTEVGNKGSIVTVHTKSADEAEKAARILDNFGAIDVDDRAQQYRGGTTTTTTNTVATETPNDADSIKIIEERMQVGKREVETGGVRLRSRIVEQAVQENVRLRSERVHVARTSVSRPATEADLANFKDATIEMTERAEVPVVGKQAYVTGEVSLEKEVKENSETVQGTVRKTEVDTENVAGNNTTLTDTTLTDSKTVSSGLPSTDKDGFYK